MPQNQIADRATNKVNAQTGRAGAAEAIDWEDNASLHIDRNADGTRNYAEVTKNGIVYRKTYTYSSPGVLTDQTDWIAQ